MRTTVTLDSDVEQLLRERMEREGVSFKRALNDAIRAGAASHTRADIAFQTSSVSLGQPSIGLDRALRVAADIEDEELLAKMRAGQ